jgi:hypothetical protein
MFRLIIESSKDSNDVTYAWEMLRKAVHVAMEKDPEGFGKYSTVGVRKE